MIYKPWPYQAFTTNHIIENKAAGALLDMGLGKTVSTLTAIDLLINKYMDVTKALVVAPKKVAEGVWSDEIEKWDHLKHLKISKIIGTERQRKAALMVKADIYIIGVDNFAWLVTLYNMGFPFDMLVIDESSLFKNHKSVRFTMLKKIRPLVNRVVILTGTPAPNGLCDLWAQVYILDRGERLADTIGGFRERFMTPEKVEGYQVRRYKPRPDGGAQMIYDRIGDICVSMKTEDYLVLPECVTNVIKVRLPPSVKEAYDKFEEEQVMALMNGEEITAINAAALGIKLTQFANGAIYDQEKKVHHLHDEKLAALAEIVDTVMGNNILCFYWFKHDIDRLMKAYPNARILKTPKDIEDWNAGKIPLAFAHPASAGHGLNLQHGGSICVWFGLTWDLQLYQQANKRLHRQGQLKTVIIHHLVATGTMDVDIMRALVRKAAGQDALMDAIKARVDKFAPAA